MELVQKNELGNRQDIIRMRQSIEERKQIYKEGRGLASLERHGTFRGKRFMRGGNFSAPKEESQWAFRRFGDERESISALRSSM